MGDWKLQVSESSAMNGHKSPYLVTLSRDDRTIYLGDAINRTSAEEIVAALELWAGQNVTPKAQELSVHSAPDATGHIILPENNAQFCATRQRGTGYTCTLLFPHPGPHEAGGTEPLVMWD